MEKELELLQDIKNAFGWPVDTFRYSLLGKERFWNGQKFSSELPKELQDKVRWSLTKIEFARKKLRLLTRVPWVQMVFITGSVASLNALQTDDIDIWLVVNPRRVWLVRALDFLIYTISGNRRLSVDGVSTARVQNKFCFNFYTTLESLELSRHSISYAIQFIDSVPIFVRHAEDYKNLLVENRWTREYFPHWYDERIKELKLKDLQYQGNWNLVRAFWDSMEYLAGMLMILKSEKKLTFSPSQIFRSRFTTWGTPRILSRYDQETLTESSQESK